MPQLRPHLWLAALIMILAAACQAQAAFEPLSKATDLAPAAADTVTIETTITANLGTTLPIKEPLMPVDPTNQPPEPAEPAKESAELADDTAPVQPTPEAALSASAQYLVNQAKEDLALRQDLAKETIKTISFELKVWPDSSLGCPQPGMKYKQVPEDGALIILQAQGNRYAYHSGGSRGLFLCKKDGIIPEKPAQIDITSLTPQRHDKNNPLPATPDRSIPPGEDQ